ncbi:MAG: DUF4271 domain-containing protein [Bacteroidia bacterium]
MPSNEFPSAFYFIPLTGEEKVFQDTTKTKKKDSISPKVLKDTLKKPVKKDSQAVVPKQNPQPTDNTPKKSDGLNVAVQTLSSAEKVNEGSATDSTSVIKKDTIAIAKIEPAVIIKSSTDEAPLKNFFFTTFSKDLNPKPRIQDADAWILPLMLFSFFFLAILNTFYNREIVSILQGIYKRGGLQKLEEQDSNMIWRCLLLFLLLFLIVSPVFMYQTAEYYEWTTAFLPYLSPYFQLMLIGAGLLGIKIITIGFLGNVFFVQEEAARYVTGIVVMSALIASILLPVSLGIKLSPEPLTQYILQGGLLAVGLCYLYSVVNGVVTGLRSATLSKFHLFLYFCTLEILPVFVIIKTVKSLI